MGTERRKCRLTVTALIFAAGVFLISDNAIAQFTAAPLSPFNVGTNPKAIVIADFNGDGKPDLATANAGAGSITVLLANGSGGFSAAANSPFSVGTNPRSLAIGDFNGDGIPDLVTANFGGNSITVLLGNGSREVHCDSRESDRSGNGAGFRRGRRF